MNEQPIIGIFLSTLAGTTMMTVFSYLVSRISKREFTEPVLLNRWLWKAGLLHEFQVPKHPAGWVIHYAIGLLFLLGYYVIWTQTIYNPTFPTAIVLGCLSGLIGIAGWALAFLIQPATPRFKLREYYFQLFIAHVIFALTATLVFRNT